ncbi:MAG: alcohol dehydrogenase catalytic domain-containing protein [Candidatus Binatia bacterium]
MNRRSALAQPLPLVFGSDLSGVVASIAPGAEPFKPGDEVFGVPNERFTEACAEYVYGIRAEFFMTQITTTD